MSNQSDATDVAQSGMQDADSAPGTANGDLPLLVVDRSQAMVVSKQPARRRAWLKRSVGLVAIVVASVAIGGLVGLYRQPPGLQWVMKTLQLEPGGGTSTPIAVPVARPPAPAAPVYNAVIALGHLVPAGKIVTVAPASGIRDARVAGLEGD